MKKAVLEANGDSYSGYERVSAMTGLPTVLGWYVHEWLWRDDTSDEAESRAKQAEHREKQAREEVDNLKKELEKMKNI